MISKETKLKLRNLLNIKEGIKNLDNNITNVVSREDGTLEVYVKKQLEETRIKVLTFINKRCLNSCFIKIDFHEVGGGLI